jgi:hypothetical protein
MGCDLLSDEGSVGTEIGVITLMPAACCLQIRLENGSQSVSNFSISLENREGTSINLAMATYAQVG